MNKHKKLESIIAPCCGYPFEEKYSDDMNKQAETAVKGFFNAYKKIKPQSDKLFGGLHGSYYSFLFRVFPFQKALESKNYALACHELETINAYEDILQENIYNMLIFIWNRSHGDV